MDAGKTKNLIILLLLLLNFSFLGIMINDRVEESRHLQQTNQQLVTRLLGQGVVLNPAHIPTNREQEAAFLSRETDVDLSFLLSSDLGLRLAGYPVVNRPMGNVGTRELEGHEVWGEIQRYMMSAPLDVQTALLRLGTHLETFGEESEILSVGMGYYFTYGPALIEFRPVWYAITRTTGFSIDRQSGEVRIHELEGR